MIEYKSEEHNFFKAEEQYILCVANCSNSKLDKGKEPLTTELFMKFSDSNIYKERTAAAAAGNKPKPGSLIIKGKLAIILGTLYPGTKEYANDNREYRFKWFKEGLSALQKISPKSIAVRENFCEEFGGDWNRYLHALTEINPSIKVSIYSYTIPIPLFNIVRFRQEDQHYEGEFRNNKANNIIQKPATTTAATTVATSTISNNPILNSALKASATTTATGRTGAIVGGTVPVKTSAGFGQINSSKFKSDEDSPESAKKVLKLPPVLVTKTILPIKITEDARDNSIINENKTETKAEETQSNKEIMKTYAANPDWKQITFDIKGWDEIINSATLTSKHKAINDFFINKELPKFGDFFKIFPPQEQIFNAFNMCAYKDVKVVIIGQDCYHGEGEAMGLAFSVAKGVKIPPSLRNIFQELSTDIPDFKEPNHGNLESWAQQGVLLLNSGLTVREGAAGSHLAEWEPYTDEVIRLLSQNRKNLVFILWGVPAKRKMNVIKNVEEQHIITAAHPSPLSSKNFFGCKCFSKTNAYLVSKGLTPIDWRVP